MTKLPVKKIRDNGYYYWHSNKRSKVYESEIIETLADTGWYLFKTNMDSNAITEGSGRHRFVRIKGETDPVVLHDSISTHTPANFSLTWSGDIKLLPKTPPPYVAHDRRCSQSMYELRNYISKENRGKYSHPRFTAFKNCIRRLEAIAKRRTIASNKVGKQIEARIKF